MMDLNDTAIVLAGGKSKRMGFDKQFLSIDGIYITEYIIDILKPMFNNIILVTNKPEAYKDRDIVLAEDFHKDFGPLGGIHIGLKKSQSLYNYIVACDMPYINKAYIDFMKKKIEEENYKKDAVITRFGNWIEPFNAFYSKALLSQVEESILSEKRKISSLLSMGNVLYIEEEVARVFSSDWKMFTNLNTEEDLNKLKNLNVGG